MSEYRLVMGGICAVCALGCAAGVWPVADQAATAAVVAVAAGAATVCGVVLAGRRELRIRRRLAAIGLQPLAPRAPGPEPSSSPTGSPISTGPAVEVVP